jgi:ferredoxin
MTATVDSELCDGCGLCSEICPSVFTMIEDLAVVKRRPSPDTAAQDCPDARDLCPKNAIELA